MQNADYEVVDGEEADVVTGEIVAVDASVSVTALERAQIDMQIATAKKYPRSITRFQQDAMALACSDPEVAESCFYSLPRGKGKDRKIISGPSIRFAEIIQYSWGNVRSEARVVAIDNEFITAQGTCLDLERNIGSRIEVKRRITDKRGNRFNEDMIMVTGNAACSIALRNAIFDVIPFALAKKVYQEAVKVSTGGSLPIEVRRTNALAWFARAGAHEDRVLQLLEVDEVGDITEEHLVVLIGLRNAIKMGDTTVDRAFSDGTEAGQSEGARKAQEKLDRLREEGRQQKQREEEGEQQQQEGGQAEPKVAESAAASAEEKDKPAKKQRATKSEEKPEASSEQQSLGDDMPV